MYFIESCVIRGSLALVIRPNVDEMTEELGLPKLARLNKLKNSARNVNDCDSLNLPNGSGNPLLIATSNVASPGPTNMFRLDVPKVPSALATNDLVLKYC